MLGGVSFEPPPMFIRPPLPLKPHMPLQHKLKPFPGLWGGGYVDSEVLLSDRMHLGKRVCACAEVGGGGVDAL